MIQLIYTTDSGVEASILFDATISEDHTGEAFIPEHPVEDGVNVTDHIRKKLDVLAAQVHVTNTPIRAPKNTTGSSDPTVDGDTGVFINFSNQELIEVTHNRLLSRAIAAPGPSLALRVGFDSADARVGLSSYVIPAISVPSTSVYPVVTRKPEQEFDRVRAVHSLLTELMAKGTVFTVLTWLRDYENMVITGISAPHTVQDGDAVTISLSMRETRFATVQVGEAIEPDPREPRGRRRRNNGAQSAEEPSATETERNQSYLFALGQGAAQLF